jgi:hypothetical protein
MEVCGIEDKVRIPNIQKFYSSLSVFTAIENALHHQIKPTTRNTTLMHQLSDIVDS